MLTYEEVLKAYQEEGSQIKVAWKLGVSQGHVSVILRAHGTKVGRGANLRRGEDERDQILADYLECRNQYEVARKHNMRQGSVSRILRRKLGLDNWAEMQARKELPVAEIVARYQAGEGSPAIALTYGRSAANIQQILHKAGVQLRGPKEAAYHGEKNHNWKGGGKYPGKKARVFAEKYVGKQLLPGTIVHHHNEDPHDNRPENLWVFPNHSCHASYHHKQLRRPFLIGSEESIHAALESGGRPLLRLSFQSVSEHATGLLALFGKG